MSNSIKRLLFLLAIFSYSMNCMADLDPDNAIAHVTAHASGNGKVYVIFKDNIEVEEDEHFPEHYDKYTPMNSYYETTVSSKNYGTDCNKQLLFFLYAKSESESNSVFWRWEDENGTQIEVNMNYEEHFSTASEKNKTAYYDRTAVFVLLPTVITSSNVELEVGTDGQASYVLSAANGMTGDYYNFYNESNSITAVSGDDNIVTVGQVTPSGRDNNHNNQGTIALHPVSAGQTTLTITAKKIDGSEACRTTINVTVSSAATLNLREMSPPSLTDDGVGTVSVTGSGLGDNVYVTVSGTNFQISKDNANWNDNVDFTTSSSSINATLYVRINPNAGIGSHDGTITATADNVSPSPTINISGTLSDNWPNAVTSVPYGYVANDIDSAEDLAWFAKQGGGNGTLTADFSMAGHPWKPIANHTGTFNGNGHVITDLTNKIGNSAVTEPGLFANINGGTVKNVAVKDCVFEANNSENYYGIIANTMTGGTVSGCVVSGNLGGVVSGNLGGVVGNVSDGTVHSCISMVAPANGGTLVHTGNVANSFAPIANSRPLVTSGTARNCIYKNTTWNYVKSDGSETTITNEGFDYGKKGCVYDGSTERLVDVLNKYAKDNSYSLWAQPLTTDINESIPVLKLEGFNSVAQASGGTLSYGNLDGLLENGNNKVLFYGKGERSTAYTGENLYIDEDAALMVTDNVKAHTSRFIANLPSKEIWHHYSSPVNQAPTGIDYNKKDIMLPGVSCEPVLSNDLFPSGTYIANNDNVNWDLYSYYEPAYHWLNFKRNALSHYKNGDAPQELIVLPTEELQNQANLRNGEGYLIALAESSYIQSNGNLNHGDITRDITVSDLSATVGDGLEGLNLLGNPYQSYLSFKAFADGNAGLWNSTTATYLTYDPERDCYTQGTVTTASSGSAAASGDISMHQGFFIVSDKTVGTYTATFTNDMCSVEPEGDVHFRGEKFAYPLINLVARDAEGLGDVAVVEFDRPEFAAAPKIFNYGGMGKVFFHYGDEDDALLFLDEETDQLPVRFAALEDGDYTIEWSTANADFSYLHLLDNMTGDDIDMLARDSYSFAAKTTDYESRFMLVFSYTGIGEQNADEPTKTFAFVHDGNLVVNGQGHMQVIDLNGRTIVTRQLTGEQNTVGLPDMAPGVYVIRLADSKESKVQKIIIK